MQQVDCGFVYSATDLNNFLDCRRLTELETLVAIRQLDRPALVDEAGNLIRAKGDEHERDYLESLETAYPGEIVRFGRSDSGSAAYKEAERGTLEAMRSGAKYIYQATFFDGQFLGHADFLRRVEEPSNLGAWSYEVIDTKLALSTKPYYIIQLCNYSEHLERLQGVLPKRGYIVQGDRSIQDFRIDEFMAYYRRLKVRFLEFAQRFDRLGAIGGELEYPIKRSHCSVCEWDDRCTQKRIDDDHLSLVARMRRDQTRKLEAVGVSTLAALASANGALRPPNMPVESYEKLQKQASLQYRGRTAGPIYELLPHDPRMGFGLLPEPDSGDVYFDMEGDPVYEPGRGLEYLFGMSFVFGQYKAFWALTLEAEKKAFEEFVDFIVERRKQFPAMHIYHYAHYEKAALQRLAQQHQTREDEVDDLLRGEVLVDLYTVVRQSVMISEDSYSIKRLEKFYGFTRETDVKAGGDSIVMFEKWRLTGDDSIKDDIERYNEDDCRSTKSLHEWLLQRRVDAQSKFGVEYPFRALKLSDEPCHAEFFAGCPKCVKRQGEEHEEQRRSELERELLAHAPEVVDEAQYRALDEFDRAQYLMPHLLAYFRREEKPEWWAYFKRCDNLDELQDLDHDSLGGLVFAEDIPTERIARSTAYTFRFPEQRHKMSPGTAHDPLTRTGVTIIDIDDDQGLVRVKTTRDLDSARELEALIPGPPRGTGVLVDATARIGTAFRDGLLRQSYPATYDLLTGRDPRTTLDTPALQPQEVNAASVSRVVQSLDNSYLFVQGPPGSGKSTIGSQVIADLLAAGMRVGVLSNSHKAIHHLLHKVEAVVAERYATFRGRYKHSDDDSQYVSRLSTPFIESRDANEDFDGDDYNLAGGTAWLFSRPQLAGKFDYLFIDEAGQVSLANAIAVSQAARNVVLLGDPSQLAQVSKGRHALHVDDSILQHLLGEEHTVPETRGVFLDRSFRMHPEICQFISDAMYDGRLRPGDKTSQHRVDSAGLNGSGLRYIPVPHEGNGGASPEEADRIVTEIATLLTGRVMDRDGVERSMRTSDIIVVTPYNAQRKTVASALQSAGIDVRVGTVDKFQGQEASVVFYSMATSSGEEGPRDLTFLFEQNRFNVAISRAQAMSVLVCSPSLLDVSCRSVEQMRLVNILCEYVERTQRIANLTKL